MTHPLSLRNSASLAPMFPDADGSSRRTQFSEKHKIERWSAAISRASNFRELLDALQMIPETNISLKKWEKSSAQLALQNQLFFLDVGQFKEIFCCIEATLNDIIIQKMESEENITPLYFLFEALTKSLKDKRIKYDLGPRFIEECFNPLELRFGDLKGAGLTR